MSAAKANTDVEPMIAKEEVARLLGITADSVARMANDGRLPAHRVGRRLRFFWSEIRAQISANKVGGAQ